MRGLHCIADLHGCSALKLRAHDALLKHAVSSVQAADLTMVAKLWHAFPTLPTSPSTHTALEANGVHGTQHDGGITLTLLLAESHVCIHTWPELSAVSLDVYVCNVLADNADKARQLLQQLIAWFEPIHSHVQELHRGFAQLNPNEAAPQTTP